MEASLTDSNVIRIASQYPYYDCLNPLIISLDQDVTGGSHHGAPDGFSQRLPIVTGAFTAGVGLVSGVATAGAQASVADGDVL
jgi:hypothetical protein